MSSIKRVQARPAFPSAGIFDCALDRRQLHSVLRHLCGLSVHRLGLGGQIERLGCNQLGELLDLVHLRLLDLSLLLNNPIVLLGLSWRTEGSPRRTMGLFSRWLRPRKR